MTRDGLLVVQGGYYVVTGLWSLFHMGSFQWVTGPKVDTWLVKTVGVLVLVAGAVMAVSGARRRQSREMHALAAGYAVAFIAVEATYVAKKRISRVYLLDALAEAALFAALATRRR